MAPLSVEVPSGSGDDTGASFGAPPFTVGFITDAMVVIAFFASFFFSFF
jgi:hypothetical protein